MKAKKKKQVPVFNKKKWYIIIGLSCVCLFVLNTLLLFFALQHKNVPVTNKPPMEYWFILQRKSEREMLYLGTPGNAAQSMLVKTFTVKVGIPGERPTPLPTLLGHEYWLIISKEAQPDNLETAPYFLTLNIPVPSEEPFGPSPYTECDGKQCNWTLPGPFGLHGTASTAARLLPDDPGSSGCIRHSDQDITYLYNLLDPQKSPVRYYIEDK